MPRKKRDGSQGDDIDRILENVTRRVYGKRSKGVQNQQAEGEDLQKNALEFLAGKQFCLILAGDDKGGSGFYLNGPGKDLLTAICNAMTEDGKLGSLFRLAILYTLDCIFSNQFGE